MKIAILGWGFLVWDPGDSPNVGDQWHKGAPSLPIVTPGLTPDKHYSVIIEATGGTIAAIVSQYAPGADNIAMYEAFAAP